MDDELFLQIALFNTFMGLINFSSNSEQQNWQKEIKEKIDEILKRVQEIEKRVNDG